MIGALPSPYLLFLGATTYPGYAKTAFGLRDWAADKCVGEYALPGATVTTGLTRLNFVEAKEAGAEALVIGVAAPGGALQPDWIAAFESALQAGLDIVSGLHTSLSDVAVLARAAEDAGRRLIEVRRPPPGIQVATGARRSGRRLLTVGTDCALGKKYTALSIARAFQARGVAADFRATGQTGIMIAGSGLPIDAVVSDFVAGAAEMLSPAAEANHWDVIEGQGSLFHPAYAGVSLGLLHGSQADVLLLCHEPGRSEMVGAHGYRVPSLKDALDANLRMGALTNPAVRCAGFSLNTSALSDAEAEASFESIERKHGLPAADPMRGGPRFARLVDACLA